MTVHVRVCTECGEEYRPDIPRCADCGGMLQDRFDDEDGPAGTDADEAAAGQVVPAEGATEALAGQRAVFVSPRATDLVPLAEALEEEGLVFHMHEQPPQEDVRQASYSLLVAEHDLTRALEVLATLVAPGAEEGALAVATRFEEGRGYASCPACGAETREGALECADCGLAIGGGPAE